jgi:hypothetical protein
MCYKNIYGYIGSNMNIPYISENFIVYEIKIVDDWYV